MPHPELPGRPSVIAALEAFLGWVETTPRQRSPVEAPWPQTRALLHLEFGWAFERLGATSLALPLLEAGTTVLSELGDAGRFVADLYAFRRREPEAEWPAEATAAFERLDLFFRFKVGKTIQGSRVLDPHRFPAVAHDFWGGELMGMEAHSDVAWRSRMEGPLPPPFPEDASTPWMHMRRWHPELRAESPDVEMALSRIERERARWPTVTDRWNTNSHWCVSVLAFVDGLLFDVVDRLAPGSPVAPSAK